MLKRFISQRQCQLKVNAEVRCFYKKTHLKGKVNMMLTGVRFKSEYVFQNFFSSIYRQGH